MIGLVLHKTLKASTATRLLGIPGLQIQKVQITVEVLDVVDFEVLPFLISISSDLCSSGMTFYTWMSLVTAAKPNEFCHRQGDRERDASNNFRLLRTSDGKLLGT